MSNKTVLQKLIEEMTEQSNLSSDPIFSIYYLKVIYYLKEHLPAEKQMIMDAYCEGCRDYKAFNEKTKPSLPPFAETYYT